MKNTTKAYLAITLQALIVGFSFLAVKIALKSTNTTELLAHRFTLAALSVLIYRVFKRDKISLHLSDWLKIIPLGISYPIFFFLFQTLGLEIISSSEAGIVYAIVPILTLITAGVLLNETVSKMQKLLMLISVSGVIFIHIMNGFSIGSYSYLGLLFILISAVSVSVYNVFARKLSKDYSVFMMVYVMSITGCIVFNAILIIQHIINGNISFYFGAFFDVSFAAAIIYLGVFSSLISSLLSTYALSRLEAAKVGLFNNVSTVVSILAGTMILKESLYYYHYIGVIAILIGSIGFNLIKSPVDK